MRDKIFKSVVALGLICFLTACVDTNRKVYNDPTEGRLLMGTTVHLGNGDIIEKAILVVKDDMITVLTDSLPEGIDLGLYEVETLGSQYHIYPFKETQAGNSGLVLARATGGNINITMRIGEDEPAIVLGERAMLLVCQGSIQDAAQFQVDYVLIGSEKIKIQKQGSFSSLSGGG